MRWSGRALFVIDLVAVEALAVGVTIFLTDASSPERFVVWAALLALPVLAVGALRPRRH
jgi:hypothetical protein